MRQLTGLIDWLSDAQLRQVVQLLETHFAHHQPCEHLSVLLNGKLDTLLTPVVQRIVRIGYSSYREVWDALERSQAAQAC